MTDVRALLSTHGAEVEVAFGLHQPLQHGREVLAGLAPFRVEVDDHRDRTEDDPLVEVLPVADLQQRRPGGRTVQLPTGGAPRHTCRLVASTGNTGVSKIRQHAIIYYLKLFCNIKATY